MGGAETMGERVRRPLPDAHRAPPGVAAGVLGKRCGVRGGGEGRGRVVGSRGEGERDQGKDGGRGGGTGSDKVVDGGGVSTAGIPGQSHREGGGIVGGGPDPERSR